MSSHEAKVFRIKMRPHPNADKLALVDVNGYVAGVGKADFQDGDLAVLVEPDTCVPVDRPEFAFLAGAAYLEGEYAGMARITVRKFRGLYSQGLVVKAPPGLQEGDDAFDALELKHFDPEQAGERKHALSADALGTEGFGSRYDLEHLVKFPEAFTEGEDVVVTEKLHGSNMRVAVINGELRVGSRSHWKKPGSNVWWAAAEAHPQLAELVRTVEVTVYGECLPTQGPKWGYGFESPTMVVFDIFDSPAGKYLDHDRMVELCKAYALPYAPVVHEGAYSLDQIKQLAEGPSILAPGKVPCREGVVVRPRAERYTGPARTVLKLVSNRFLEEK